MALFFQNFNAAVVTKGVFGFVFRIFVFSEFQGQWPQSGPTVLRGGGARKCVSIFQNFHDWSQSGPNVAPGPAFAKTLFPPLFPLFFFFNAVGTKWT